MTYDFRRRLREPGVDEQRPHAGQSNEAWDAWYERYVGTVVGATYDHDHLNFSNAFERLVVATLFQAGALWAPDRAECCDPVRVPPCAHLRRGPDGRVSLLKLASNEGWHVEGDEAAHLGARLKAFLAAPAVVEVEEIDHSAFRPDAPAEEVAFVTVSYDLAAESSANLLDGLRRFATFCSESDRFGFEVW